MSRWLDGDFIEFTTTGDIEEVNALMAKRNKALEELNAMTPEEFWGPRPE